MIVYKRFRVTPYICPTNDVVKFLKSIRLNLMSIKNQLLCKMVTRYVTGENK